MRVRRLTAGEVAMATHLFGAALNPRRVWVVAQRLTGRTAMVVGPFMLFPLPNAAEDFAAADVSRRAWFVHELTHAWQFQTRPLWTLMSWARTLAAGGYGPGLTGYRYTLPLPAFASLNLEQQAAAVQHAYALSEGGPSGAPPHGATAGDYAEALAAIRTGRAQPRKSRR